ncbi:MAG: hypothetical protein BWX88_01930 [Planctomycetes bacterium ADurb.Bin126]|nr:MAG: hypothetical protein BWX88_01930 [Planctomycetes bacterium ADurb.Bin126]HOD81547.1 hypothetical protein [Phycisphaerae bacterium]HQL72951.1 hypothetical protein [Phycisphaerae bacterium]
MGTYADDVDYLKQHAQVVELTGPARGRAVVVPAYQGRVMTSTATGSEGRGSGWINTAFIDSGSGSDVMNNYGGIDRFWLGPEAGQFGLYFPDKAPFELDRWRVPEGLNTGSFEVTSQGASSVAMANQFRVANYSGTTFDCAVKRTIAILPIKTACRHLNISLAGEVEMVAIESKNVLANVGGNDWTRQGGLLSIWILGMFKALAHGRVVVPFIPGDETKLGPRATTNYFGALPSHRGRVADNYVSFACDGNYRSKIGVSPPRARDVFGSYDAERKALIIVQFTLAGNARDLPYVNSLWEVQDAPYAGDAVNSYNDGKADRTPQEPTFYELETSSPAAELPKGQCMEHVHRTYQFVGPEPELLALGKKILGVDLNAAMH